MKVINPATEEVIMKLETDDVSSVNEKWEKLRAGQVKWSGVPIAERIAVIRKFHELLEVNKVALAHTLTSEMGKPLQQSYNELEGARNRINYFLENSEKYLAEEWITSEGTTREKIVYEPLGVIANISAWNYPYLVGVNVFIPALLGGNTVLYKPSEYATLTGLHISELLYQAGLPEDCFQALVGGGKVGELLLDLPLDGYFFTGSYKTGKHIAEKVAPKLVPCQLELGGKDPLYVMDDVEDIVKTAADALEGAVYNNGQSCCAVERIYVHERVYDAFVESFVAGCNKLVIGDPLDAKTEIGPLSRSEQREFLLGHVTDAIANGARVLCGGDIVQGTGFFFQPTVMVNVNHSMSIMQEESFGPLIGIQKVTSDQEALEMMQDTVYGLTAAIYSASFDRAEGLMKQLNTGTVYWNCCDRVSASLPWSGRKISGLGSTLSYQGIRAFVQPKAYHLRG